MAYSNICGFELGADSGASGEGGVSTTSGLTGTASIVTSPVRSGEYSLRVNPTTTGTGYFQLFGFNVIGNGVKLAFNSATTYVRFYFRYATLPASNDEEIVSINQTSSATQKCSLRINSTGNLVLYDSVLAQIGSTGSTVLSANTWYIIEISVASGLTAAVEVKLGIDGGSESVEISGTGNTDSTNAGNVQFGKANNRNSQTVDFFYDDIAISDSAYPGPGKILRMDIDGDGTNVSWTIGAGAGSDYQNIDDYASQADNDGDTTYLTTSTNTNSQDAAFESAATAGISGTVNVVKVITVARDESQILSYNISVVTSDGTTSTSSVDGTNAYTLRGIILSDPPGSPTSWTTTILGGIQVRITHAQSQARPLRCTAMSVMVDFTPDTVKSIPPIRRRSTRFFIQRGF